MNNQQAFQLFSSDSYLTVNKSLLRAYGPEPAIFISNLIDKYLYFYRSHKLKDKAWFFQIHAYQMQETGLTEKAIRKCKAQFKLLRVLETKTLGIPAKEWYKINIQALAKLVNKLDVSDLSFDLPKTAGLGLAKTAGLIKEPITKDKSTNKDDWDKMHHGTKYGLTEPGLAGKLAK